MRPSHTHFPHYVDIEARENHLLNVERGKIFKKIEQSHFSQEGHFAFLEEEFPQIAKIKRLQVKPCVRNALRNNF